MTLLNFNEFLNRPEFSQWKDDLSLTLKERWTKNKHGHLAEWLDVVDRLPEIPTKYISLDKNTIIIGSDSDAGTVQKKQLLKSLQSMSPWRKGPYNLFGIFIDTEWRSDWKWQRIYPHISNLKGRKVLDIGCGSGYHCWRMLGEGASYVLGVDPTLRFYIQYLICQNYIQSSQFDFIPVGIEDLPKKMELFDTTFSMGVLYHRRDMQQHIIELRDTLIDGGELVLETLIVDDNCDGLEDGVLTPEDRYAAMRNVWNIPTINRLEQELKKAGFNNIQCIEENITSLEEQRKTDWIRGYSLREFLDPKDTSKTREGYPAPKRATFVAKI
jgi:tRNA (mo5U34)-methyltransferase